MNVFEASGVVELHHSESSTCHTIRLHTYEQDGFSNEVFVFSSNIGCSMEFASGETSPSPPFLCGRPTPLVLCHRDEEAEPKSRLAVSSVLFLDAVDMRTHSREEVARMMTAAIGGGALGVVWLEISVEVGFAAVVRSIWKEVCMNLSTSVPFLSGCSRASPSRDTWARSLVIAAPLNIRNVPASPCRLLFVSAANDDNVLHCDGMLDVTHAIDEQSPFYPGGQQLLRCPFMGKSNDHCLIVSGCDVGTHVDSPSHFVSQGRRITDLLPEELVLPVVVIDCRVPCTLDPDYAMTVDDILKYEGSSHCRIPARSLVCMWTGWSSRFASPSAYKNADPSGVMHFPAFSVDAAKFLIEERHCAAIGVDTLSLDVGTSETFPVHSYTLAKDRYQVENIQFPADMVASCFNTAVVLPLPIRGAFEAMARVALLSLRLV